MTVICDHTSIGILVWRNGRVLLIERRNPPFGIAPPAGHVDQQGSFETAARSELRDEVGLRAMQMTLVWSGSKPNACRREGGTWHYWRVYEAEAEGDLKPSETETKAARWYSLAEISKLERRTRDYTSGTLSESDWQANPGLEVVWTDLFRELRLIGETAASTTSDADVCWARDYAWKWFAYHAQQRMTVFQFYLITFAFLFAGFGTLTTNHLPVLAMLVACTLLGATWLFWRLDLRNRQLVKISEDYLKTEEGRVSKLMKLPDLAIAQAAEQKWHRWPYSFTEIHKVLFVFVGVVSLAFAIWSGWQSFHQVPELSQRVEATVTVKGPVAVKGLITSTTTRTAPNPSIGHSPHR